MSRRRNKGFRIALAVADARREEAAFLLARRFEDEDRHFAEAIARSAAADERCLARLAELPAIREGLKL